MYVDKFQMSTDWRAVADAARTTIGMGAGIGEPGASWKKKMLQAEHSPIRLINIHWKWSELKSWVSVHFVRHKIGIEHFVRSQRADRTGIDRETLPQSALVDHECIANAQAVITISRKRLCKMASKDTQDAWKAVVNNVRICDPILASVCVPECVYRGFCPEIKTCGFSISEEYNKLRKDYVGGAQ